MKRKNITLQIDQTWKIGKGTVKKVSEINGGLIVSDTVKIVDFVGIDGLLGVRCVETGVKFDIVSRSLTTPVDR